jgi:Tfp pilus assembly protein PilF
MNVRGRLAVSLVAAAIASRAAAFVTTPSVRQPDDPNRQYVGNDACRRCHEPIFESYAQTAMARTSGPAIDGLIAGSFTHARSGVTYRTFRKDDAAVLSYERPGDSNLRGSQTLAYYVGSNTRGRAFLFEIDGFLYQTPINYYAKDHMWGMSPGYDQLTEMQLNHAVDASCLFCHAGLVQPNVPGTTNRFRGAPFLQNGIACETCHGPGSAHVEGRGAMINPAELTGERRDSICLQCHLEGQSRIRREGKRLEDYRPGDRLSDFLSIFVREDAARDRPGAVSQVESLAASVCKRKSGDAMSCLTCHDPHVKPSAQTSARYYRDKCLTCHARTREDAHFAAGECTSCHMPRLRSADIGHTAVTDHRILRHPGNARAPKPAAEPRLVQVGNDRPDARDLGLAYAELALRGDRAAGTEARRLLEAAFPRHPSDPDVLTWLGYLHQQHDDPNGAAELYERALKSDPDRSLAATNLGVIYARRGLVQKALRLWSSTFDANPQESELGVDLAIGLCAVGDADDAERVLLRVLKHNPDFGQARRLLKASRHNAHCGN